MNITPLEIRQKSFEKVFRGIDKDEVQAYLLSLSQEWERVSDENKNQKMRLEAAEKEIQQLRDVELSLFKTLKTAEDTGANLIEQASREAELQLKETRIKSDEIVSDAKDKAKRIIENTENKSRLVLESMMEKVKEMEKHYTSIENQRDNLLSSLNVFTKEILDKLDRLEKATEKKEFKEMVNLAKITYNDGTVDKPVKQKDTELKKEEIESVENNHIVEEDTTEIKEDRSFFDELD